MGPMELPYVLELYVHVKEKKPAEIHIISLLVKLCIRGNISKHTVIIGLHVACVYVHLKKSRERRNVPARVFNTLGKARRVLVCSKFGKRPWNQQHWLGRERDYLCMDTGVC